MFCQWQVGLEVPASLNRTFEICSAGGEITRFDGWWGRVQIVLG